MHEARLTRPWRRWLALGVILLLLGFLALWTQISRLRRNGGDASGAGPGPAAPAGEAGDSAAEEARRAAIARLGPIKKREGTNGADLYKEAMGLYAGLTEDEKKMLADWKKMGDPNAAAALYAKIQPIMDLLRQARKANYWDWDIAPFRLDGSSQDQLREVAAAQQALGTTETQLGELAMWDASYRFQSDPDGAVGDLAAMEAMVRSTVESRLQWQPEQALHSEAVQLIAQNAGNVTNAAGQDLAYVLDPSAMEQTFQSGMSGDNQTAESLLNLYSDPATKSQAMAQFQAMADNENRFDRAGVTPEQVASEVQWTIQARQSFSSVLMEPDGQFQEWLAGERTQAGAYEPVVANRFLTNLENDRAQVWNAVV